MTATKLTPNENIPANPSGSDTESDRLLEVLRYGILDTPPEQGFDDLTLLAAQLCQTPIAAISFIDADRQWLKSSTGLDIVELPRLQGFCHHTLRQLEVFEVSDAPADSSFADSPLVRGMIRARYYAGVPLMTRAGHAVGTLFVLDRRPRELTVEQKRSLLALGRQVVALLDARWATEIQNRQEAELRQMRAVADQQIVLRTADLRAANEQLEAFAYSVSHDLCSPLRAIDTYAQMLAREFSREMGPEAHRQLALISQNVRQMRQLITGLLQFSRFSRQPLHRQKVAMTKFVSRVVDELPEETEGHGRIVRISDLPDCEADPLLLKQLFTNLLGNALKFTRTRKPASITVGSEYRDGEVIYHVRDNGVGFDMHYADRLFGVFQRLHRSEEFEGTGVGLSIVKRIVHRHGGRVWAEGKVDGGATFYFTLPAEGGARPVIGTSPCRPA